MKKLSSGLKYLIKYNLCKFDIEYKLNSEPKANEDIFVSHSYDFDIIEETIAPIKKLDSIERRALTMKYLAAKGMYKLGRVD